MDKELHKYSKHLKTQSIINAVSIICLVVLIVLGVTGIIKPQTNNPRWTDFWNGYITGICFAALILSVISIILNIRALKNKDYLKKLYIKENDERTKEITCMAGKKSYFIEAGVLGLGTIVGGYFNITVSLTCLVGLICLAIIRASLAAYYSKKL